MKTISFLVAIIVMASGLRGAERETVTIRTLGGKTYEQCRILKAYPDGLAFAHANGRAQIPFAQLGDDLRQRFNYNPEAAQKYVAEHRDAEMESLRRQREHRATQNRAREERMYASQRLHRRGDGDFGRGDHNGRRGDHDGRGGDHNGRGGDHHGGHDRGFHNSHAFHGHDRFLFESPQPVIGCTVFPVNNLTTFGGYRYPNQFAFGGVGVHGGLGACGTAACGPRPFVRRSWRCPSPSLFTAPCRIPSGGMRIGGTGGLIQASSGFIGHR